MFHRREHLETKTPEQLRAMRRAGLVVASALAAVREVAVPGATTRSLDDIARQVIAAQGARPSFLDVPGYRHALCVSVNDEVVHGLPAERVLQAGDLVSVDCGAVKDGWHGDAAISLVVGGRAAGRTEDLLLMDATESALWAGIAAFRVGADLNEVGGAVEDAVTGAQERSQGITFGVVEDYTGHGIGREMHMAPDVYNYRVQGRTAKVRSGSAVAIEPMVTLGSAQTRVLEDDWTVVTVDGSRACHWEHTVAATEAGVWVLTAPDGGAAALTAIGAPYGPLD